MTEIKKKRLDLHKHRNVKQLHYLILDDIMLYIMLYHNRLYYSSEHIESTAKY